MSAFSVSDLLNPAPLSHHASPAPEDTIMEDAPNDVPAGLFAPDLFQAEGAANAQSFAQDALERINSSEDSPGLDRNNSIDPDSLHRVDSLDANGDPAKKNKSTRQKDPEKLKDTRHSSKNEGQHTDRRYLCYLCHKLFTRRRSVRDHLVKIHQEKTWEPSKSLEVIVEPHTGEPFESLEEIIARGPLPPSRSKKSPEDQVDGDDDNADNHEGEVRFEDTQEILPTRLAVEKPLPTPVPQSTPATAPRPNPDTEHGSDSESEPEPEPEVTPVVKPEPNLSPKKESTPARDTPKLKTESSMPSRTASVEPSSVIGKKRPAPTGKKGTAKVKSSNKKPKLLDSERSTPGRSPSVAPVNKLGSKLKKALGGSPAPSSHASSRHGSPSPIPSGAESADTDDEDGVFCICRKGDNHTWMIACDGGCEEWYHGKCVNVPQRDGDLIDKYICFRCEKEGYVTTWKRMCRRNGCRKAARVIVTAANPVPSKYCSRECGRLFFVDLVKRGNPDADVSMDGQHIVDAPIQKKRKKKVRRDGRRLHGSGNATPMLNGSRPHTPNYSDEEKTEYETDSSADEDDLPNKGGALRAGELKAVLEQCKTVDQWRALGRKPATPPREVDSKEDIELEYDDFERVQMGKIKAELEVITEKCAMLEAREQFLELIKTRSAAIADEVKKSNPKTKDICGYDPRLAWTQDEFVHWYKSGGQQAIASGKIGVPGDTEMKDADEAEENDDARPTKGGVCIRNRCPKHGSNKWQKQQLAELRFEQDLSRKRTGSLEAQEKEIRSRAQIRLWEKR